MLSATLPKLADQILVLTVVARGNRENNALQENLGGNSGDMLDKILGFGGNFGKMLKQIL